MTIIPYGKHFIDESDIQAVINVLRSGQLTQGSAIEVFEKSFSNYVGSRYAVAVSSCTAGLHLAARAAGLGPGDTLITSPITFVASANAGLYVGASVAFADIDPLTTNIDPKSLSDCLANNPSSKAVVPVHFGGLPCDMERIKMICDQAGVAIIEDAAHALGATYTNGKKVGSCCHSLMTVFSLHPVKAIAAGEGGVITTNDENLYRKLLRLRSHGINKKDDSFQYLDQAFTDKSINSWYYEMQELGFHYRITDIQCALANSQLKKLDAFINKRRDVASVYENIVPTLTHALEAQPRANAKNSARHLYVIRVKFKQMGMSRAEFQRQLGSFNIGSQVHYIPVPMHPYYRSLGHTMDYLPNALSYYDECLSIPVYYSLESQEVEHIAKVLAKLLT